MLLIKWIIDNIVDNFLLTKNHTYKVNVTNYNPPIVWGQLKIKLNTQVGTHKPRKYLILLFFFG